MTGKARIWLAAGALAGAWACGRASGPLPPGAALGGYSDAGAPESYSAESLYTYMDGGAETFREYGLARAWVRRYGRGSAQLVVELYEMKDEVAASSLFSFMRRAGTESDLAAGCRASLTETEVKLAKGTSYLVCRNEDPMAKEGALVKDLCARIVPRISGECGVGSLFAALPSEGRVAGSEVAVVGPLGFNQRPWLTGLGAQGFQRGWLALYTLSPGSAEAFVAEYASSDDARRALGAISADRLGRLLSAQQGPVVVLIQAEGKATADSVQTLRARLFQRVSG